MTSPSSSSSMVKSTSLRNSSTPSLKMKLYSVECTTGCSSKHKQKCCNKCMTWMLISSTHKNQKHSGWLTMSTKCNQSNRKCRIRTFTSAWSRRRASHVSGRSRTRRSKRRLWKKQSSATPEHGVGSWWKTWIRACTSNKLQSKRCLQEVMECWRKFELWYRQLELTWMIMLTRTT